MRDAALAGQLLTIRCGQCRRSANYWASDMVKVVGYGHQVHVPPFPCSRCRFREYMRVEWRVPNVVDLDSLIVRRPVKQVSKWLWTNEKA